MKSERILAALAAAAGMAIGVGGVSGQTLTPPNGTALAQSWAYATNYMQTVNVAGGLPIEQFRLIVNGQPTTGSAYQSDLVMRIISPNGTELLIGGDSAGTMYPGAVEWVSLPYTGTPPGATTAAQAIDATFDYNFGPGAGEWQFNFFHQWTGGSVTWNDIQVVLMTSAPGACCLNDGTCVQVSAVSCGSQGGTFAGGGVACGSANCPTASGCCFLDGTCSMLVPAYCTSLGGVSTGGACGAGTCPGYEIVSDRPGAYVDILSTGTFYDLADDGFTDISSAVGNALLPAGTHRVSNNGAVSWNNPGGAAYTNQMLPSDTLAGGGLGLAVHWDDLYTYAALTGQGVYVQEMNGNLYITWNVGHIGITGSQGVVQLQVFGSGPVIAQYIYQNVQYGAPYSNGESATIGIQRGIGDAIQFSYNTPGLITDGTVLSIVPALTRGPCYANCDSSTTAPALNVADFTCFLQQFAAANPTANCDNSTTVPTLNVADFTCFLQAFAAGCP